MNAHSFKEFQSVAKDGNLLAEWDLVRHKLGEVPSRGYPGQNVESWSS